MNLGEFKKHIESFPEGRIFPYGISQPFSWRGSYDEVAFSIIESEMSREEILCKIEMAFTDVFNGYKGGEFTYQEWTDVHFESERRSYTDGGYCAEWIAKLENNEPYRSQEMRLIDLITSL